MAGGLTIAATESQEQGPAGAATVTTLSIPPKPSAATEPVVLVARVALANPGPNAPTGTVEFFDLETSIGTATLSTVNSIPTARLEVTALAAGPHSISARYLGDSHCAGSRSPIVAHVVMGQ
jgi:hypothetical protein